MVSENVDWRSLKSIRQWMPISQFSGTCERLSDGLYKVSEQAYLTAVDYHWELETNEGGPFITLLMWASNDGAARRVWDMEIEADNDHTPAVPPPTILLAPGCLTYGEILAELKSDKHGGCMEYADYRIAKDGAFVHRVIDGKQFKFFFRSLEDDDSETPYAIQYRLGIVSNTF